MKEENRKQLTLCIPCRDDHILLGMKKRGFGEGRWNGFGGKLKIGEMVENSLQRELHEEIGIEVSKKDLEKRGVATFEYQHTGETIDVHIFRISDFQSNPVETEEMRPAWFRYDRIPYEDMWPDDSYWLPVFLEGERFKGHFIFSDFDTIIDHRLEITE